MRCATGALRGLQAEGLLSRERLLALLKYELVSRICAALGALHVQWCNRRGAEYERKPAALGEYL
jgi:hypothetical protein